MQFLPPLTEAASRRRARKGGVVEDGEYFSFDINLMDSASAGAILTDAPARSLDQAIRAQVDREHGAHDAKFAFMGDRAPPFDRERAEFLARQSNALRTSDHFSPANVSHARALAASRFAHGAKLIEAPEGSNRAMSNVQSSATATDTARARPAAIDALRFSRYGE